MYAYLYVSVYVYVYTYMKYCLLQVLPLYLTCTRVCVLVRAHVPEVFPPEDALSPAPSPPARWVFRRALLTSLCIFQHARLFISTSKSCSLLMASSILSITWFRPLSTQLSMYFWFFSFPIRARSRSLCSATCQRYFCQASSALKLCLKQLILRFCLLFFSLK